MSPTFWHIIVLVIDWHVTNMQKMSSTSLSAYTQATKYATVQLLFNEKWPFSNYRVAVVVQFEFGSLDKPSFVRPQAFLVLQHAQWVQSISPKGLKHLLWHLWYQFFSLIRYFSPKIGKKGVKFVSAEANSPPVSIYCSPEKWLSSLTLQPYSK